MSADDETPPAVGANRPELVVITEALAQFHRGETVAARCHSCGAVLEVVDLAATGALVVTCPHEHVSFRARRATGATDRRPPSGG